MKILPPNLFHGSPRSFKTLKSKQPTASPRRHWLELLRRREPFICLTPHFDVALFFAAKREGVANMMAFQKGIAYLGKPELFDPDRDVYVYVVDSSAIPEGKYEWKSEFELRVRVDEITPFRVEVHKAEEIFRYFEALNSKEEFLHHRSSY